MSVRPDKLLKDLADIWLVMTKPDASAEPGTEAESAGVLRACSMTLVILADDEDDPQDLNEILAQLMREHPSRAIVVRLKEGSDQLDARVFAQCWKPHGHSQQICCEQVEIVVSVNRLIDVPSIVSPLTAPDLPTVVWFRSARVADAPDISGFLALGQKLIVDSSRPGAPSFADLRVLAGAGHVVGDLAWTRLTALRQLTAQLLEGREPGSIAEIVIEQEGRDASREARYLRAWLRSSLPAATVDFHHLEGAVHGPIRKISILPDIEIKLDRDCADYVSGPLHQHATLPPVNDEALLNEELNIMKRDPVFERALQRMSIWTPVRSS